MCASEWATLSAASCASERANVRRHEYTSMHACTHARIRTHTPPNLLHLQVLLFSLLLLVHCVNVRHNWDVLQLREAECGHAGTHGTGPKSIRKRGVGKAGSSALPPMEGNTSRSARKNTVRGGTHEQHIDGGKGARLQGWRLIGGCIERIGRLGGKVVRAHHRDFERSRVPSAARLLLRHGAVAEGNAGRIRKRSYRRNRHERAEPHAALFRPPMCQTSHSSPF